ncbi:MAG: VanW family protein [bacterium]
MSKKKEKIVEETATKLDLSKISKVKVAKITALSLGSVLVVFLVIFGLYSVILTHKIYAHQYVGSLDLGLKTKDQAVGILEQNTASFVAKPIDLTLGSDETKKYQINPADLALKYDPISTVDQLWQYGRRDKIQNSFWEQLRSLFYHNNYEITYSFNQDALNEKVAAIAKELDRPEKDYAIYYSDNKFSLTADRQNGSRIDQALIRAQILKQFNTFSSQEIVFSLDSYEPKVPLVKAEEILAQANKILAAGDIIITYDGQEFRADADMIGSFLKSKITESDMQLAFADDRIKIFVDSIAKLINTSPANAKLAFVDGKITILEASHDGKILDTDAALSDIKSHLLSRISQTEKITEIALKVSVQKSEVSDDNLSALGINELIGTATTDFKGSPTNRVHNITVGAAALNGILLKSGDEFSTLSHLGAIDASTGYLPELVIKEDRTVPEFGGGLCQVSSTLFRAALQAGMKITERQSHKYRVSYYEPPVGMDATIYDPAPDFKFLNNYSGYILIQSKIEKTKITFEFYGTKDGRKISISDPALYDYTNPEPPSYTETDTLAPGQTKLLEKAHQGVSAKFDYRVESATGDVLQAKTFLSKYVPWQERWLIGKAAPVVATCTDGQQNNDETGIDCGGTCPNACPVP